VLISVSVAQLTDKITKENFVRTWNGANLLSGLETAVRYKRGLELKKRTLITQQNMFEANAAMGFVMGIVDVLEGETFDLPEDNTFNQIAEVIIGYLISHPLKRYEKAVHLVISALEEAFPIKDEQEKEGDE